MHVPRRCRSDSEHEAQRIVARDHRCADRQQDQRQQRGAVAADRRAQQRMLDEPYRRRAIAATAHIKLVKAFFITTTPSRFFLNSFPIYPTL
jgi:hypothetical protein